MKRIYNSETQVTIWTGEEYLVDGQPGVLPSHLHLLTDVDVPAPVIDSTTHKHARFQRMTGDEWQRGWDAVALTPEEIAANIASEAATAREEVRQALAHADIDSKYVAEVAAVTALPDADALAKASHFPPFEIGESYVLNERFYFPRDGKLYKVAQSHTSAIEWLPDATPALYVAIAPPGVIAAWEQPAGAHDAYQIGDRVTHAGSTWDSALADNVWEPGVFGWITI